MPTNIVGREYDMRPYKNKLGRIIITNQYGDRASFWMVNGQIRHEALSNYRIDTLAFCLMVRQFLAVKNKNLPIRESNWR